MWPLMSHAVMCGPFPQLLMSHAFMCSPPPPPPSPDESCSLPPPPHTHMTLSATGSRKPLMMSHTPPAPPHTHSHDLVRHRIQESAKHGGYLVL